MKIMVGFDGTEAAQTALQVAARHAKAFEADIYVVTSLEGGAKEQLEDITR